VYLTWALRNRAHYFRHILAVTFTNKATQEMKDRVLAYLAAFTGTDKERWPDAEQLAGELKIELKLDDATFRENSSELLTQILHQYDQFSISTIDAFFQRVIRAFTRESGLLGDYRLEVDQDAVLNEVVDNLIDELKENHELTTWVVRYAQESLESDKTWDIRKRLVEFSREIFRDEFKVIEEEVYRHTSEQKFFPKLQSELTRIKNEFITKVSTQARTIQEIMRTRGWTVEHFKGGKTSGIKGYLDSFAHLSSLKGLVIKDKMKTEYTWAKNWPGKKYPMMGKEIEDVAEKEFVPRVRAINETFDKEFSRATTAELVLQHLYVFGLMTDIARKLREYKAENNVMLLADAPKFLNKIIGESDTPFVYEKVGSFYRNYLIDEFQDTSGFQWKNFMPLVVNSLDQGDASVVVGDVKQAIYRWRGGDLGLLQKELEPNIGPGRVDTRELTSNFRSSKEIVDFNNLVFEAAAKVAGFKIDSSLPSEVYHDVRQKSPVTDQGGVRVDFLADEDEESWKDLSFRKLTRDLEYLQLSGISAGEIAILVRTNYEGQEIAAHLLKYKNSSEANKNVSYEVVSNESLRIDGASSVNLLLGALRHLVNPDDPIARAQLCYEYARLDESDRLASEIFSESGKFFFESQVPEAFTKNKLSLKKLPLFELTETLIGLFGLGKVKGELAYLQAFQDLVLDFYTRERNDIAAFLEWWEENKKNDKTSIKLSGEVDAVNIMTIHKAKGLQFPYVLIPFCSWKTDHEGFSMPLLWVTSPEAPYADIGPLPVKYSSALGESLFASAYEEERSKVFLDNLNVLYVALTRAERGIIITAPAPKSSGHAVSVASWLFDSIQQSPDLLSAWNESAGQLQIGNLVAGRKKAVAARVPLQLDSYDTGRWRDQLVIRQAGNIFFNGMTPDTRERISYGIYLHALLSRIRTTGDTADVLNRLVLEGLMTSDDRGPIEAQLNDIFSNPVISNWFDGSWEVRTEVPILLPGGDTQRIDRLMLKDQQAVVVDFKTGEPSKADHQQVTGYIDILKQMGFTAVEGYLLYTRDKEVVQVGKDKPKVVKRKKDDKQLGLDF
jgi:ATP-dependent helicase/nuclease subunit A